MKCPDCNDERYIAYPITHPTNPNLDSWGTMSCTNSTHRVETERLKKVLADLEHRLAEMEALEYLRKRTQI
jgi:hypothetical protein